MKGIPGYTGHGPKVYAENIYGTTFKERRIRAKMLQKNRMEEEKERLEQYLDHS